MQIRKSRVFDLLVIGAGPSGLACGIQARKRGLEVAVIEKGCIVNSIYRYPENMTFFTTAELLEIGEVPFIVDTEKPKRVDALKYYRRVVEHYALEVIDYEGATAVEGRDLDFRVKTVDRFGQSHSYHSRKVVIATGYFDNPNKLGIPGEDLAKVSHYYSDAHPYYRKKVAVIGGKNSAAIAALELFRNGAEVTLIHRREAMGSEIKYWILPDISNRIKNNEIRAYFSSTVEEIRRDEIVISTPDGILTAANDFVFALTGYHPDSNFLQRLGIEIASETCIPQHNPKTLETNVKGIYLAGSIISGKLTNRVFIENGRFHGDQILPHIEQSLRTS